MRKVTLYCEPDLLRTMEKEAFELRQRGQFATLSSLMRTGWRMWLSMDQIEKDQLHARLSRAEQTGTH